MSRIAVLGGGPSGLYAALLAAEAGHEVTVFEAAERVGGMAASITVGGVRVDHGSHRLHPATAAPVMARLRSLLGDDLQARERNGRIRLRDRWVGFPLRTLDMARQLPPDFCARVAADTALGRLRRGETETFAGLLRHRLGPTIVDEFYGPYARKLYGAEPEALDAELARRRVAASSPVEILMRAVRASRSEGRRFWYPRLGYGQITEALADEAASSGASVLLNSPVARVARRPGGGWRVDTDTTGSAGRDVDLVFSTIAPAGLARAMAPPPAAVDEALAMVRTRAMVLVYLVLDRAQYTPFDAHYFPETSIVAARLSEPKNYRDGPDPIDRTVLCAEIACWVGDELYEATADELADIVVADLARAGLPEATPVEVHVERLRSVYPIYEPETRAARELIDQWQHALPDLLAFGRQGLAVPDNVHHVLAMGEAAVAALNDRGAVDHRGWATSRASFADHVVQD